MARKQGVGTYVIIDDIMSKHGIFRDGGYMFRMQHTNKKRHYHKIH